MIAAAAILGAQPQQVQTPTLDEERTAAAAPKGMDLAYTSTGFWQSSESGSVRYGRFAYGIPTGAESIPRLGKASYLARVDGDTASSYFVTVTSELDFESGQGSLGGKMILQLSGPMEIGEVGTFTFRDTIYSSGSISYSGRLEGPGAEPYGSFSGQFAGPEAAELLGSFRLPISNAFTNKPDEASGIWLGKRK